MSNTPKRPLPIRFGNKSFRIKDSPRESEWFPWLIQFGNLPLLACSAKDLRRLGDWFLKAAYWADQKEGR